MAASGGVAGLDARAIQTSFVGRTGLHDIAVCIDHGPQIGAAAVVRGSIQRRINGSDRVRASVLCIIRGVDARFDSAVGIVWRRGRPVGVVGAARRDEYENEGGGPEHGEGELHASN